MSTQFLLFLLFIHIYLYTCEIPSVHNSNCSLSFQIQTITESNQIPTDFPIHFLAYYNLTCNIEKLTAYYKITPLSILVFGKHNDEHDKFKSMVKLHTTQFKFNINCSSTIRLCILSDTDHEHRICRQIHIGIKTLHNFWNLPMKIFYISLIYTLSTYYMFYILRDKWYQPELKSSLTVERLRQKTGT